MIHICPEMYFHIKILFIAYYIYNLIQTESSVFQQEVGGFMIQKIHHLRSQVSNPRQNGQPLFVYETETHGTRAPKSSQSSWPK